MAVSRTSDRERQRRRVRSTGLTFSRYDLHLLAIPLLLLASAVAHLAVGLPLQATLVPASLVGTLLVVDAVFLNPPVSGGNAR